MNANLSWLLAIISSVGLFASLACFTADSKDYPIKPVPFTQVQIQDQFWSPRMETNRTVTIPHAFQQCEETGRIDNFAIAGGLKQGEQHGTYPFDDTDIYKTLEGASYALMLHPDQELEDYLDALIEVVGAAQEQDGYLYTARTNSADILSGWSGDERWARLERSHELYDAGHLYEAAVAHYQATGKRNLLDIALKNADLIEQTFGPGRLSTPPGHQVIEMGLAKLYRVTGEDRYLQLAKYLLDVRGRALDGRELGGEYNQDHKPVLAQDEAVGHAVRAAYMYAGMADVAALDGDASYIEAIDRIWENVVSKKLYLTGGIGARGSGEAFGENYYLPNMSAYNETCASIGNVYWNHRLFLLHGDAKYLDILERTLYNALLAGISLDGKSFFYPNPLESVGQHERSSWFTCACCPGNITRFMASLPGYLYAQRGENLYVNLFASNKANVEMAGGTLRIRQETRYPWDGRIQIVLESLPANQSFTIYLRIPGWERNHPVPSDLYRYLKTVSTTPKLEINGEASSLDIENGFAGIRRRWKAGDTLSLDLSMPIRRVVAHEKVLADKGKVALERGPLVFCAEWPDNKNGHVRNILIPDDMPLETEFQVGLLGGVQVISGRARGYELEPDQETLKRTEQDFMAIPYYAWAHRGKGEMSVWLARDEAAVTPLGRPTLSALSKIKTSFGKNPEAVNDLLRPAASNDQEVPFFHCWPHKGTKEWVQYDFPEMAEVSTVEIYWLDDTGVGECRLPKAWRVLYREGGVWKPVHTEGSYTTEKDRFNQVVFETVSTDALRVEFESQAGFASGIHEWVVK